MLHNCIFLLFYIRLEKDIKTIRNVKLNLHFPIGINFGNVFLVRETSSKIRVLKFHEIYIIKIFHSKKLMKYFI